jgi:hypothetical protein
MVLRSSLSSIRFVALSQLTPKSHACGEWLRSWRSGTASAGCSRSLSSTFSPIRKSGTVLDIFGSAGENEVVLDRLADEKAVSLGFSWSRRLASPKAVASQRIEFPPIALAIRPGSFGLGPWIGYA